MSDISDISSESDRSLSPSVSSESVQNESSMDEEEDEEEEPNQLNGDDGSDESSSPSSSNDRNHESSEEPQCAEYKYPSKSSSIYGMAVDLASIDHKVMPRGEQIRKDYPKVRKAFRALRREREQLRTELHWVDKEIEANDILIPDLLALVANFDETLRSLYGKLSASNSQLPPLNPDIFNEITHLNDEEEAVDKRIEDFCQNVDDMQSLIIRKQQEMIRKVVNIAKGFYKDKFASIISKSAELITQATGLTIEELCQYEDINTGELKRMVHDLGDELEAVVKSQKIKEKYEVNNAMGEPMEIDQAATSTQEELDELMIEVQNIEPLIFDNQLGEKWWEKFMNNGEVVGPNSSESEPESVDENPSDNETPRTSPKNHVNRQSQSEDQSHGIQGVANNTNGESEDEQTTESEFDTDEDYSDVNDEDDMDTAEKKLRTSQSRVGEYVRATRCLTKKIAKIRRVTAQLRKKSGIFDIEAEIDLDGEIKPEDIEKVRAELNKKQRKENACMDQLKRVHERLRSLKKTYSKLKDKEVDEKEIAMSTEMLFNKVKLCQLAAEIKLYKKEYQRLSEYEKYFNTMEKLVDEVIKKEETELDIFIDQLTATEDDQIKALEMEEKKLKAELSILPSFSENHQQFAANATKILEEFNNMKDKMLDDADQSEEIDKALDDFEVQLDEYTANFSDHIRIEFDDPMIKGVELLPTNLQQDDVDLINAMAQYQACREIETITEEQIPQLVETIEEQNSRGLLELLRLKQTLIFLESAAPEDKRKFYTKEAERRVRFTRHYLDRVKELWKHSKEIQDLQTKSEEALGERCDHVETWIDKIEEATRKQEEKNNVLFAEFLKRLPVLKQQAKESSDSVQEIDESTESLKNVNAWHAKIDQEFENTTKTFDNINNIILETALNKTVDTHAELHDLVTEEMELDVQIQQEERRLENLAQKREKQASNRRKLRRKLDHEEDELGRNKQGIEDCLKVKHYGSYEKMLEMETKRLREIVTCSNCLTREKSCIITKCNHIFCYNCIEDLVKARNRKCPKCKLGFGTGDYRKIFLGRKQDGEESPTS